MCTVLNFVPDSNSPERLKVTHEIDVYSMLSLLEMSFCAVAMCFYSNCDVTDISVTWTMMSYNFLSREVGVAQQMQGIKGMIFFRKFSCFQMVVK